VYTIYFDRRDLPDLGAFLRFEPLTTGEIRDDRGEVLIQLAREYRRVVSYDELPPILRDAILAAEDKNFFTHSGVEYRALPRVIQKTAMRSLDSWRRGDGFRSPYPQGGSTLTQQLVRVYFLRDLTIRENGDRLVSDGYAARAVSWIVGVRGTNTLLRKTEELRLSLWLEEEMRRRYGSAERAKQEIFERYANFIYLGNGRYGFASASEYYFGKPLSSYGAEDADKAASLAGIGKSPRDYAPAPDDPRPLRRRNAILALMVRNRAIPEDLASRCRARPIVVAARSPVKTDAPAAISHVLEELQRRGDDGLGIEELFQGRIVVHATVDARVQAVVNASLEAGLARYEARHRTARGAIQGSVVVLRNADAAVLAEAGGRRAFEGRDARYTDLNRVTDSLRQAGSAWKPMVYLAAFRRGLDLDTEVPDEPIGVPSGTGSEEKWITNYDNCFLGPIPVREALAASRNAATVWIAREIGVDEVNRTSRQLGIHSALSPYLSTALGSSDVRLLELAGAYRAMASGIPAEPHVVARVTAAAGGAVLYEPPRPAPGFGWDGPSFMDLSLIQEGLRGVVRLPEGTAHALDDAAFGIPVMGKTGTTSDFRDALFVGSTYGAEGITVAVRIGYDDNRVLGDKESGSRAALPIFREIVQRLYRERLVGPVPTFPPEIESRITDYLEGRAEPFARSENRPRCVEQVPQAPIGRDPLRVAEGTREDRRGPR
jgi:penicillin-binding protein 1A